MKCAVNFGSLSLLNLVGCAKKFITKNLCEFLFVMCKNSNECSQVFGLLDSLPLSPFGGLRIIHCLLIYDRFVLAGSLSEGIVSNNLDYFALEPRSPS